MTERDAILDAYYERLRLLFVNCADDLSNGLRERFDQGLAQARAARDKALKIVGEAYAHS